MVAVASPGVCNSKCRISLFFFPPQTKSPKSKILKTIFKNPPNKQHFWIVSTYHNILVTFFSVIFCIILSVSIKVGDLCFTLEALRRLASLPCAPVARVSWSRGRRESGSCGSSDSEKARCDPSQGGDSKNPKHHKKGATPGLD